MMGIGWVVKCFYNNERQKGVCGGQTRYKVHLMDGWIIAGHQWIPSFLFPFGKNTDTKIHFSFLYFFHLLIEKEWDWENERTMGKEASTHLSLSSKHRRIQHYRQGVL